MNRNITSADSTLIITVSGLLDAGFACEMYSADAAFAEGDEEFAEARMGVDWHMVAGATNSPKQLTITLEPPSPSISYFETWMRAERAGKKKYWCNATINLPSLSKTLKFKDGVLQSAKMLPDANKTLQPRAFVLVFESVE